jgi:hypothetical protein
VDHTIPSQGHLRAEGDLFQQDSVLIHRRNAQVRSAEINANGEVSHVISDFQLPITDLKSKPA